MIEINLIPDVKREYLRSVIVRNLVIMASIIVGIVVIVITLILFTWFGVQLATESSQDKSIEQEGKKLIEIKDLNKIVTIQQQLSKLSEQHSQKKITSRLLDVMVAINPPAPNEIKISMLHLDPEEKTIKIEGVASRGYAALEVFKKTIRSTKIQLRENNSTDNQEIENIPLTTDITAGETSFGEDSSGNRILRFDFYFTYPDELFDATDKQVSIITASGKVDVTDSKVGIPQSLFTKRPEDIKEDKSSPDEHKDNAQGDNQ